MPSPPLQTDLFDTKKRRNKLSGTFVPRKAVDRKHPVVQTLEHFCVAFPNRWARPADVGSKRGNSVSRMLSYAAERGVVERRVRAGTGTQWRRADYEYRAKKQSDRET
jgi:hypothetical protein